MYGFGLSTMSHWGVPDDEFLTISIVSDQAGPNMLLYVFSHLFLISFLPWGSQTIGYRF
jgi:hypothetical protein